MAAREDFISKNGRGQNVAEEKLVTLIWEWRAVVCVDSSMR